MAGRVTLDKFDVFYDLRGSFPNNEALGERTSVDRFGKLLEMIGECSNIKDTFITSYGSNEKFMFDEVSVGQTGVTVNPVILSYKDGGFEYLKGFAGSGKAGFKYNCRLVVPSDRFILFYSHKVEDEKLLAEVSK